MAKLWILAGVTLTALVAEGAIAQSAAEQDAARANFREADANGDRQLSRQEFRAFINANADDGLGRAATVRRFGAYDRAFDRLDRNGNGVVTPSELSAARSE